jgi:hypothetical protein
MILLRRLRWMLFFALFFCTAAFAVPLTEDQKIDALIHSVEVLPDAQFIRNGSVHDGKAAAAHLRMKRRFAGSRIHTANDFIEGLASRSSETGQPYQIRFSNGKTEDASVFFHTVLSHIESVSTAASSPAGAPL